MIGKRSFLASFIVGVMIAGTVTAATQIDRTGSFEITFSSEIGWAENGYRVFDDTTDTKWLTAGGQNTGWITFDYSGEDAHAVDSYTITSANDAPDRTPKDWTLQGSDDGANWTVLDTRTNESNWNTFEKRTYTVAAPADYKMYKLDVTANNGSWDLMGFSEMELLVSGIDTTAKGSVTGSSRIGNAESERALFDNADQTKWLTQGGSTTGWVEFDFTGEAAYAINGYSITSANDYVARTPKDWTLEGSNGAGWIAVDSRTDEVAWTTFEKRNYVFDNPTPYQKYRLNVTANNGDTWLMGFSELDLLEITDDPQITFMSPKNFTSTSANPLVLKWDATFETGSATYSVYFGTDPDFVNDTIVETGITTTQWTVPETAITDDTAYFWRVDIVDDPYGTGTQTFTGTSSKFRVLRQPQKILEWSMDSYGAGTVYGYENPIQNVVATASSQEQDSRSPGNTTGPGMSIDPDVLDTTGLMHNEWPWDMWISDPTQEGPVWIQYAFDQAYQLGNMLVWNHNVGGDWTAELDRGMRNVTVMYSTFESSDPNDWTVLGDYEIPQGTGLPDMPPSIAIDFAGAEAQYVRIQAAEVDGNWGAAGHHALSEVRFGVYNQPVVSYVMPDTSGNGNDGSTYVDPQLVTEAIAGTAMDLTGNDMVYMEHTDPNAVETLPLGDEDCYDSWSMNYYTVLPETPDSISFMIGFGDFDTGTGRYIAQFSEGIRFWGGHNIDGITNEPFDLNRWQMITATYENNTLRIYKNGTELLSQVTDLGVAIPKVSVCGLSPWRGVPSPVKGQVDEFTIYRGALSQADIDVLASAMPTQYAALDPVPADASTNVEVDPILEWSAPLSAIDPTYTVYLGTDETNMSAVASGLTETTLDTGSLNLAYGTTYYWSVDTSSGDISETWSFTTLPVSAAPELVLDWDFENLTEYVPAYEQAIENVVVTASSQEQDSRSADRAANGVGVYVDPFVPDASGIGLQHSSRPWDMWISDPAQEGDVWIKFDFDQTYSLGTMLVWNHNVGEPWTVELSRGMRNVTVLYSETTTTDPNLWTPIGDYELPQGTGEDFMPPSLALDLGGIEAQSIIIRAHETSGNWGATGHHALSEVRFGIEGTTAEANVVVPDASGNGNIGMVHGTPEFVSGLGSGQCVQIDSDVIGTYFDHIEADIADPNTIPTAADDTWSMNFFINLDSDRGAPAVIAGFGGRPNGTGRFIGRWPAVHFWGGDNVDVSSNPAKLYRFGHWQMVTATYSGTELKLYYNGELVGSGSPTLVNAEQRVTIAGMNPWMHNQISGLIDNFELYRGVLSRTQIAELAATVPMEGDMNWDGTVDISDLPDFVSGWLAPYDPTSPCDLTGDGYVDLDDFTVMAGNWLEIR